MQIKIKLDLYKFYFVYKKKTTFKIVLLNALRLNFYSELLKKQLVKINNIFLRFVSYILYNTHDNISIFDLN